MYAVIAQSTIAVAHMYPPGMLFVLIISRHTDGVTDSVTDSVDKQRDRWRDRRRDRRHDRQCDRHCDRHYNRQHDRQCDLTQSSVQWVCPLTLSWPMALTSSRRACRGTMHWGEAAASTPTSIALIALFHILQQASPLGHSLTQLRLRILVYSMLCGIAYRVGFNYKLGLVFQNAEYTLSLWGLTLVWMLLLRKSKTTLGCLMVSCDLLPLILLF